MRKCCCSSGGNGAGGLVLQAVTTGMLENQASIGGGIAQVDKENATNPGVRLQCELPSILATSAVRMTWINQVTSITVEGGGFSGVIFRPRLSFPDDAIPDLRVPPTDISVALQPLAFVPQGHMGFSLLFPMSATLSLGGPPTGRVQMYMQFGSASAADVVNLLASSVGGFGSPIMCLEEVAGIVVQ